MNTSIFVASPREKGNSNNIANYFHEGIKRAKNENQNNTFQNKLIRIPDYNIKPCIGCGYCDKNIRCSIKDDDMQKLYPVVEESDVLVFVTPVYFASVPAQFKAFIDRFQPYYAAKYLLNKPIIPKENNKKVILYVVSGYNRKSFFDNVIEIMEIFCLNLNIELYKSFYFGGIDQAKEILNRPQDLDEIESFAKELPTKLGFNII